MSTSSTVHILRFSSSNETIFSTIVSFWNIDCRKNILLLIHKPWQHTKNSHFLIPRRWLFIELQCTPFFKKSDFSDNFRFCSQKKYQCAPSMVFFQASKFQFSTPFPQAPWALLDYGCVGRRMALGPNTNQNVPLKMSSQDHQFASKMAHWCFQCQSWLLSWQYLTFKLLE